MYQVLFSICQVIRFCSVVVAQSNIDASTLVSENIFGYFVNYETSETADEQDEDVNFDLH